MKGLVQIVREKGSLRRDGSDKHNMKIHYFSGEEFNLVVPLARDIEGAVSIAVAGKAGWFLRVRGAFCFLELRKQSRQFGGYKHEASTVGMPMLGRGCLKLKPLLIDRFKVVHCLESNNDEAVSFEYVKRPGWFVRANDRGCFIERRAKDVLFEKDCSFFPLINLWYPDYVAFESVTKAAHYLRMKDGRMVLDHYDGTPEFKEEASFRLQRKNRKVSEETNEADNLRTVTTEDAAGSDCFYCSDCVSEVSFQIYEESSFICENCECKNDLPQQEEKSSKNNLMQRKMK